jgi:hypothetical protein
MVSPSTLASYQSPAPLHDSTVAITRDDSTVYLIIGPTACVWSDKPHFIRIQQARRSIFQPLHSSFMWGINSIHHHSRLITCMRDDSTMLHPVIGKHFRRFDSSRSVLVPAPVGQSPFGSMARSSLTYLVVFTCIIPIVTITPMYLLVLQRQSSQSQSLFDIQPRV